MTGSAPARRVVVLGATGYTGRLVVEELLRRGIVPVLAARSADALAALAGQPGRPRCETVSVDVTRPEQLVAALRPGDLLISTVGPFLRLGSAALDAALTVGAHYLDTTGEAPFVRRVYERDAVARAGGLVLLPATGFDFTPGHLAGALALEQAGPGATALDIGYFLSGDTRGGLSGGTRASATGVLTEPTFCLVDGQVVTQRCGASVRSYQVDGRRRPALSLGCSEPLSLPRLHPGLRELRVHQGGLGPLTRVAAGVARVAGAPPLRTALTGLAARLVPGSTGGPDAATRARSGTRVVALARAAGTDPDGPPPARVDLAGPNVYDLTAALVAWVAERLVAGEFSGAGALGPVEAFGLDALEKGCAEVGLVRTPAAAGTA